jgi:arsenate reductase-like glutaredoxin family protein
MQVTNNQSDRERVDDIRLEIEKLDKQIEEHENEIRRLKNDKGALMKELGTLMDSKTEEMLLNAVYEQRKVMKERAQKNKQ